MLLDSIFIFHSYQFFFLYFRDRCSVTDNQWEMTYCTWAG